MKVIDYTGPTWPHAIVNGQAVSLYDAALRGQIAHAVNALASPNFTPAPGSAQASARV